VDVTWRDMTISNFKRPQCGWESGLLILPL